jgi:diguanylate cyclase (GGDEF)-like protein/PAS domain S-box-containing protein
MGSRKKLTDETLQESASPYATLLNSLPLGVGLATPAGEVLEMNSAMYRMTGYQADEIKDISLQDTCFDPQDRRQLQARLEADGHLYDFEVRLKRKDGTPYHARLTVTPLRLDGRNLLLTVCEDISERRRMEEAAVESEKRYRELWEDAPVAYHTLDRNGIITSVNRTEARMLGYDPDEMVGTSIFEFILPEQRSEAQRRFELKVAGVEVPKADDRIYVRKDGTRICVSIHDVFEWDENNNIIGVRTSMVDVTDRLKSEETIRRLAYYDVVTNLPNRTLFGMRLATALVHAHRTDKKMAVMLFDVDNFKNINDTMGHSTGDRILRTIGSRLIRGVHKTDTVARMGGDEFLVLLPEIAGADDALKVAERILDIVKRPVNYEGTELLVTASAGLAVFPDHGTESGVLIRNADAAMYKSKDAGKNMVKAYEPPG